MSKLSFFMYWLIAWSRLFTEAETCSRQSAEVTSFDWRSVLPFCCFIAELSIAEVTGFRVGHMLSVPWGWRALVNDKRDITYLRSTIAFLRNQRRKWTTVGNIVWGLGMGKQRQLGGHGPKTGWSAVEKEDVLAATCPFVTGALVPNNTYSSGTNFASETHCSYKCSCWRYGHTGCAILASSIRCWAKRDAWCWNFPFQSVVLHVRTNFHALPDRGGLAALTVWICGVLNDKSSVSCDRSWIATLKKYLGYTLGVLSTPGVFISGVKREGVDRYPSFNTKVKNTWSHVSTLFTLS
jgi:hypothetical protein